MKKRLLIIATSTSMALSPLQSHAFFDDLFSNDQSKSKVANSEVAGKVLEDAKQFASANAHKSLSSIYLNLWAEGERNAVLNLNYLGLAAIEVGEYELAKNALDESIYRIEAIYADDKNAEKAKSLWNEEKVKDFKGEPYERSMTYYYRGLLYIKDGDYQNARASFLSAERHDTLSEQEKYQGDFGLMNYLAAWSSYCDGDQVRAKELHERAITQDKTNFENSRIDYPFLVLTETGHSPVKTGSGKFQEVLEISGSNQPDEFKKLVFLQPKVSFTDNSPKLLGDLAFQSTTRGGRPIQGILNGKASFKNNLDTAGDVAVNVGTATMMASAYSGDRDTAGVGLAVTALGALGKLISSAVAPKADLRYWSTIPSKIYVNQSLNIPSISSLDVKYLTVTDEQKPAPVKLLSKSGSCGFAVVRTHSSLATSDGGLAKLNQTPEVEEANRADKNTAFRNMLVERFAKK